MPQLYQDRSCEQCGLNYTPKTLKQRFCSVHCKNFSFNQKTIQEVFFDKIEKTDTHWFWRGYTMPNGYGSFGFQRKFNYAHRFSYEYFVGPIPEGLEIDHTCKVRNCVNPAHLEPVTTIVNQHRANPPKTHCAKGHEYTPENTRFVKDNKRQCRTCARNRYRDAHPEMRFTRKRILQS